MCNLCSEYDNRSNTTTNNANPHFSFFAANFIIHTRVTGAACQPFLSVYFLTFIWAARTVATKTNTLRSLLFPLFFLVLQGFFFPSVLKHLAQILTKPLTFSFATSTEPSRHSELAESLPKGLAATSKYTSCCWNPCVVARVFFLCLRYPVCVTFLFLSSCEADAGGTSEFFAGRLLH